MRILAAALVLLVVGVNALADERADKRTELKRLLDEVDARRQALRELDKKERSILTTIGELDRSVAALEQAATAAAKRRELLLVDAARLDEEVARAEARRRDVALRLERRLRALYVLGDGGAIRHLIGADSFEDLAYRRKLLTTLAENDARLVREHAELTRAVREKRATHQALIAELDEIAAAVSAQRDAVKGARAERSAAVRKIDEEKELLVKRVKELVAQQAEVKALLDKLAREQPSRPAPTGKGVLKRGALLWPVDGKLARAFGTVREAETGARITSNGVHLSARLGAPVQAAAGGRVVHKGWLRGYGLMVILDHGDGVHTLYAHLQREIVEKGDAIERGQTIGFVGDTESFDGPELYFEVRKDGRPRDPAPYLAR